MLILTDTIMIDNVSTITIETQPVLNDTDGSIFYDVIAKGDISVVIATFDNKAPAIRLLHSIQDEYAKGSKTIDLRTFTIAQLDETISKIQELRTLRKEANKTKQKIDDLKTKLNGKYGKLESEADDNAKKEETRE